MCLALNLQRLIPPLEWVVSLKNLSWEADGVSLWCLGDRFERLCYQPGYSKSIAILNEDAWVKTEDIKQRLVQLQNAWLAIGFDFLSFFFFLNLPSRPVHWLLFILLLLKIRLSWFRVRRWTKPNSVLRAWLQSLMSDEQNLFWALEMGQ